MAHEKCIYFDSAGSTCEFLSSKRLPGMMPIYNLYFVSMKSIIAAVYVFKV